MLCMSSPAHRIHTHSVHDVHTVCSQARTMLVAQRIHLQVSHVTPMLVVPTSSHFQTITALSGPRDLLQDNTSHRQALPQEPLQLPPEQLPPEPLPANAIRSENNAKKSLSDLLNKRVPEFYASTLPHLHHKFAMNSLAAVPEFFGTVLRQFCHFKVGVIAGDADAEAY